MYVRTDSVSSKNSLLALRQCQFANVRNAYLVKLAWDLRNLELSRILMVSAFLSDPRESNRMYRTTPELKEYMKKKYPVVAHIIDEWKLS